MHSDQPLQRAREQVEQVATGDSRAPMVAAFFDEPTFTASYVAHDPVTGSAAIIDSVLGFDPASGRITTEAADRIAALVLEKGLTVEWLLETHVHADHVSAAFYLQEKLGGRIAIGKGIRAIQAHFGEVFNEGSDFARDGSQFDRLFDDGDSFRLGDVPVTVLCVPGHTPADVAYIVGDAAFAGDTMFMPDYGTARADFPGGDASMLYRSIRRLMELPDETRLFMCHDYKAPNRDSYAWETSIGAQRCGNVHVRDGVSEEEFVAMRTRRDASLSVPRLILPSVQINMRGGRLPSPEKNGTSYLKLPLNLL